MKKLAKLSIVLFAGLLVFTGCGKEEEVKTLRCTKTGEATTGVEADLTYEVTYKGDYVQKVHTVEKLKSDNEEYLNQYKELVEAGYEDYKDVKYYDYSVEVKNGVLTSTVDIDYSKIDTDKMIEINSGNAALIKDGKVKVDDMKTLYETVGATCK